jgi:hypothetical protein
MKKYYYLHFACAPSFFPCVISRSRWFFVWFMCSSVQTENTIAVLFLSRFTCDFSSSWLVLCTSLVFLRHLSLPSSFHASVLTAAKIVLGSCFCHSAPCVTCPAAGAVSIFLVHTWIHRLQAPFLPWFVHSCVACALLFLVRFSFSRAENDEQSSLARTQLVFFGSVAGVASSTSIFYVIVLPNFVGIVAGSAGIALELPDQKTQGFLV